ncbi:PREDICTED: centrosomal protein cep57l1-like isoform X2 [Priapulus caudatus]|uniref:Centrosomal protein cep57l1-like isoform X2 n=1 Tax=Priapulus caudatus TaxID=37621 RepID=A0ABM1DPN5_PRICU|nr:PREDICTED: centrosomal protein cep57l1-like isoform X2 [Priapulus caudatus]
MEVYSPRDFNSDTNYKGVIEALRNLRDKIRQVDNERSKSDAKTDPKSASEGEEGQEHKPPNQQTLGKAPGAPESCRMHRCILETQCDNMRWLYENAQREMALLQQTAGARETTRSDLEHRLAKLDKLESDYIRLSASQRLAQMKMKKLEEEEERQRQEMQELLAQVTSNPPKSRDNGRRTASVQTQRRRPEANSRQSSARSEHYQVNFAEIPFVVGTATSKSHSVGGNIQGMLAALKTHSSLCDKSPKARKLTATQPLPSSSHCSASELSELMAALEKEFSLLAIRHEELQRQMSNTRDAGVRDDIASAVERLVNRMDSKGHQIAQLRKHLEKVKKCAEADQVYSSRTSIPQVGNRVQSNTTRPSTATRESRAGKARVVTATESPGFKRRISRPKTAQTTTRVHSAERPLSPSGRRSRQESLELLKNVRTITSTLSRDDICWE